MQPPFVWLLALGLLIRLPALWHPVEEGQRNAQTASLTANMIEEGHLRLDPIAPWRGDLQARLVQELPIYNLVVLGLKSLLGTTLDFSGRLVSLILWVLGFWMLQKLWRLGLAAPARFWANLLFVFAPMSWYLSTAFMPENLVQLLSILFVLLVLHQACQPSLATSVGLVVVAALGLLVKLPSFAHLGLFMVLVLMDCREWRVLLDPVLWGGGALIVGALLGWSQYMQVVNSSYFPYWSGLENLAGFVQPANSRLSSSFWVPLLGYNLAFILPLVAAPFAILGVVNLWKKSKEDSQARIWFFLLASLIFGWLLWGKGAAAQAYYNLPNLVCLCAFFGAGMAGVIAETDKIRRPLNVGIGLRIICSALILGWGWAGCWYLSRPDETTLRVAEWVRSHTKPEDLIIYQPRHTAAVMDYEHQPLLSHASGRRTWIWSRSTPQWEKARALETASCLIVTIPPEHPDFWERLRQKFKGSPPTVPVAVSSLYPRTFVLHDKLDGFLIYFRL